MNYGLTLSVYKFCQVVKVTITLS